MRTVCVLPFERNNNGALRSVYAAGSTILMQEIEEDQSIFETASSILDENFQIADELHDHIHYVGSMVYDNAEMECIAIDLTDTQFITKLKGLNFNSIIRSERGHTDALLTALCFKAVSYFKITI